MSQKGAFPMACRGVSELKIKNTLGIESCQTRDSLLAARIFSFLETLHSGSPLWRYRNFFLIFILNKSSAHYLCIRPFEIYNQEYILSIGEFGGY